MKKLSKIKKSNVKGFVLTPQQQVQVKGGKANYELPSHFGADDETIIECN